MSDSDQGRIPSPSEEHTSISPPPTSIGECGHTRIDTSDPWRFGGPGTVPDWPLTMVDPFPSDVTNDFMNAVGDIANKHIEKYDLQDFFIRGIRNRFSKGATPTPNDITILIQGDVSTHYKTALSMLDELLTALVGIGWPGRVEVVDNRALNMRYFAPRVSNSVQEQWPNIEKGIMERLDHHNLEWVIIFVMNRGYWDEVSEPTVIAKINAPITNTTWREAIKPALRDMRDYLCDYQLNLY